MEQNKKTVRFTVLLPGLAAVAMLALVVTGGSIDPSYAPGPTMRTLDEIYKNIQPGLPSDWKAMPDEQQVTNAGAIHMSLTGQRQGVITGSCTAQGREGSIVVVGYGHDIYLPTDTSGQITGQRVHRPLVISKYLDKSSPRLMEASVTGERLTNVTLKFYRAGREGLTEQYYTIVLQDAYIIDIQQAFPNIERVSFNYRKIRWTWEPDHIECEDDLLTPK